MPTLSMGGWSGAILLNSPVDCELRRDMRRGIAEGLCGGPCRPKVGVWVTVDRSFRAQRWIPTKQAERLHSIC